MADKPESVEDRLARLERFCFGGEPSPDCPLCKGKGATWRAKRYRNGAIVPPGDVPCECTKPLMGRLRQ